MTTLLFVAGCGKVFTPRDKAAASAVWLGETLEEVEASQLARLKELGVSELFVRAGRLDPGTGELEALAPPSVPAGTAATIVIGGGWPRGESDPQDLGKKVGEALRQLRFELEARGVVPAGVHLDWLDPPLPAYAKALSAIRKTLDRNLFLSVTVPRSWVGQSDLEAVCDAVDFVVPFLYGQRVQEAEDAAAWDFIELERNLQVLEQLGTPYMLGLVTLGTAAHLGKDGQVKARTTRLSLREAVWNRDLKMRPGFSLEGVNRRVLAMIAERSTEVGDWSVRAGEQVRLVGASTADLEELRRLLGAWHLPSHLGEVYYRLPRAPEKLSLSLGNLVNAIDPSPATPEMILEANVQRRTGRGFMLRFSIRSENAEPTALSLIDSNFLEVRATHGHFGRVRLGDFFRYDLYQLQDDGELKRTFRRPDVLRLYLALLEGRQAVSSGDVELLVEGEPSLEMRAHFLLNDARELEAGPIGWSR